MFFLLSLNMDPIIIIVKKQQQQQQQARQLQQKTCLVGRELKKKQTVNMFLESYSAIFSKTQF